MSNKHKNNSNSNHKSDYRLFHELSSDLSKVGVPNIQIAVNVTAPKEDKDDPITGCFKGLIKMFK